MIAFLVAAAFAAIALIHVYWAFGGSLASEAAVPRAAVASGTDPKAPRPPAFVPTRAGTLAVAAALAGPKRLAVIPGAEHNQLLHRLDAAWWRDALAFLLGGETLP